jgi:hypothetical protein
MRTTFVRSRSPRGGAAARLSRTSSPHESLRTNAKNGGKRVAKKTAMRTVIAKE